MLWRFKPCKTMLSLLGTLLLVAAFMGTAYSEPVYRIKTPFGQWIQPNGINQKRAPNSLILYNPQYGLSTKTNPYGVEVIVTPSGDKPNFYRVQSITDFTSCQQGFSITPCGDAPIPQNGFVLSANGSATKTLLSQFTPGLEFEMMAHNIHQASLPLTAINPTAENNPSGSGFPGFRGGNQLLMYNSAYGQSNTGTNEFGYEVTVVDNRVVVQEGANSLIPMGENAFVLSGHGKARDWLLKHAVVGARIDVANNQIISTIDKHTYLMQLDKLVDKIHQLQKTIVPNELDLAVQKFKLKADTLSDEELAQQAMALKEQLYPKLWASYPSASTQIQRAVWHRPSEKTVMDIQKSLDRLKQTGVNTLYLETYLHGDPIFPSKTFEKYHIPQKLPFKLADSKADLLQTWLNEAHKRGMKVHVWFQTFYAGNKQYDSSMGTILATYPAWANIQRSALDAEALESKQPLPPSTLESGAYFLDPANPEVQAFVLALIEEICTRYPIDGFQLDYIRYPASFPPDRYSYTKTTWGYSPFARQQFMANTGLDPATLDPKTQPDEWAQWNDYKTAKVNQFVQKAHDMMKIIKPSMPISAAIFPKIEESLSRKHQNWALWAQNGWIDAIAPMTLTSATDTIVEDTLRVKHMTKLPVITGIFGPFNGNSATDVVEQVWSALSNGAVGVALFDTAHLTDAMTQALKMGVFKTQPDTSSQRVKTP